MLPKIQGFTMPAEWECHTRTWMAWPYNSMVWRAKPDGTVPAQTAFVNIVKSIGQFEPVFVGVCDDVVDADAIGQLFSDVPNVTLFRMQYNDCWLRDTAPTFLINRMTLQVAAVDWEFNCWGEMGKQDGLAGLPYESDAQVANQIINKTLPSGPVFQADFVMEGGSFHVDGEGTVLVTEECLLNPNRNPSLTKIEIENHLLNYLGAQKVIWLPLGLFGDEDTNGHIDNFCCFFKPAHLLLAWSDDESDPQYDISRSALRILESSRDAQGRQLTVVKLPIPPPMTYDAADCEGLHGLGEGSERLLRTPGSRLAASYVNFYIANGGVIVPGFGDLAADAEAVRILQEAFPDRKVVQVFTRDIVLGGGNIHCITQQQV